MAAGTLAGVGHARTYPHGVALAPADTSPIAKDVYDSPNPSGYAAAFPSRSSSRCPCHRSYVTVVAFLSNGGRSASSRGIANGSRPPGSRCPSRTSASAEPPSIPGYQATRTAGTSRRQASIVTAAPASTTTTVRGFAAATARTSSSSAGCSRSESRSPPTDCGPASQTRARSSSARGSSASG